MASFDSEVRTVYGRPNRLPFDEPYAQINRRALAPFFRPWLNRRGRILDAGAGRGDLALDLEDAWILDLARNQLVTFRDGTTARQFIQGDIRHLPFADNTFDLVLCSNVLHYTGLEGFRELVRVTRSGGHLLVAFFQDSPWTRNIVRVAVRWGWFPRCSLEARLIDISRLAALDLEEQDSLTVAGFPGFFFPLQPALRRGLVAMILKKGKGIG